MHKEHIIMRSAEEILSKYRGWKPIENDADFVLILKLTAAGLMQMMRRVSPYKSNEFLARTLQESKKIRAK